MKKNLLTLFVAALITGILSISSATEVNETGIINVTVSLKPEIIIRLSSDKWDIGQIGLNQTKEVNGIKVSVGNIGTKVDIAATEPVSGWKLGDTPGDDQFVIKANGVILKTQNKTLFNKIEHYGSQSITLQYQSPTKDSKGAHIDQNFNISFKASIAN